MKTKKPTKKPEILHVELKPNMKLVLVVKDRGVYTFTNLQFVCLVDETNNQIISASE